MRSARTNRRELKAQIARLTAENAEMAKIIKNSTTATAPACVPVPENAPPVITHGGFPTTAEIKKPRTLKEAKEILMSMKGW